MHIVGEPILWKFFKKHADGRSKAKAWHSITKAAIWHTLHEVRMQIPSADGGVKGVYTIFNIRQYRVVARIDYSLKIVQIVYVFTHAQYLIWSNIK
jgi:mRNA-degrading endonuclease HigB of HigAB toxin-antitoxin module